MRRAATQLLRRHTSSAAARAAVRQEIAALTEQSIEGGGIDRIDQQHAKGKLTARERLDVLLDTESFREIDALASHRCDDFGLESDKAPPGDGVVAGFGTVHGRPVCVFSQDFTVFGGSLGEAHAAKIVKVMERALHCRCPIIGLSDSGGARIQEGVLSLAGYADVFQKNVDASGIVPQLSLVLGPCAGGAVYSPAMTDFLYMSRQAYMFVTGPDVVKAVTNEVVSRNDLGGADVHCSKSGVAHGAFDDDLAALKATRTLLGYLPQSYDGENPDVAPYDSADRCDAALNTIIPDDPNTSYDMREVVKRVVDGHSLLLLSEDYAPNIITAFARLNGRVIGVVANDPRHLAGCLDADASTKAARFVRFCDAFDIPLVTFVDVPGFLPGVAQEHGGIIRHGAKLLFAYAEASVPKLTVITRKAYGGAYDVMSSKHLRGDANYAWPSSEIAVMGAAGAAEILHRGVSDEDRAVKAEEYASRFANPLLAAKRGFVDAVLEPSETRPRLIADLEVLRHKERPNLPRKHSCGPL